ncbi:MAG: cytochrome c peroxidase [Pseudomonadota bacterium]
MCSASGDASWLRCPAVIRLHALRWVLAGCLALAVLAGAADAPSAVAQEPADSANDVWRAVFAPRPVTDRVTQSATQTDPLLLRLGRALFTDPRALSADGTMSCATCHRPERAFTDGRRIARGRAGHALTRNTPTLLGIASQPYFNWDGSAPTLGAQFERPITSRHELAGNWSDITERLNGSAAPTPSQPVSKLRTATAAFIQQRGALDASDVRTALVAYVRSLRHMPTRFDAWLTGDTAALTPQEKRGFQIFTGAGQCVTCHASDRLTDDRFHDIGIQTTDPGRAMVTGRASDRYRFKTPTLRAIARTAPYFHNGSAATLEAVVDHYAMGGIARPTRAETMPARLKMTPADRAALVAFLKTL